MLKYLAAAKLLKKQKARVDNVIFHLHYRVTFIIFVVCSGLITAKEYFGKPIQCYSLKSPIPRNVLDTYCFIMGTYSVTKHNQTGVRVVYPGVGPHDESDDIVYHSYYQWVPLVLFLQAVSFYIPRFIWKSWDAGLFTSILQGLETRALLDNNQNDSKYKILMKYMTTHINMHRMWAIRFFVCELLCMFIVVMNIYLTDLFLGGTFMSYGNEVLKLPNTAPEHRVDPMDHIFPRVTKCTFRKFGTSGNIETHDSMCILAVNILNVKIYIFIWYWMMTLTALTAAWIIYRMVIIFSSSIRSKLLNFRGRLAGRDIVDTVAHNASMGDWFLLYHLGRCMHPIDFAGFLRSYAKDLTSNDGPPPALAPSAPGVEKALLSG